jgi:hypothetical protein
MIIYINNGNYSYRFEKYEIILRKKTSNVTINIFNKEKNKKYIIQITDEQLKNDDYFQSIKIEYNVLELFGLSNIELFMILIDNSIKKNTYSISWFKMTPLNIRNDTINFNIVISPSVELSFTLEFAGYI